ncbi:9331_t:CDS:2, partial [Racocetra fulgida]
AGIVEGQFLRISTTAAAIWQQMMKISSVITILKQNRHIKRTAGQILVAQLRDYHVRKAPYNALYTVNVDNPKTWWETCESKFPYLQLLAIKLFSVSPHAASCERIWSTCGWIYGQRRVNLSVENIDAIAQVRSNYIANNKFELPRYSENKSAEDIRKILYNADLYEETDTVNFEQAILNANINQSSVDDDNNVISQMHVDLEPGSSDWLEEFNQEDYDPAELGEMFLNN